MFERPEETSLQERVFEDQMITVLEGIQNLNLRFSRIEMRMGQFDSALGKVDMEVGRLEGKIQEEIIDLDNEIKEQNVNIEELKKSLRKKPFNLLRMIRFDGGTKW